MDPLNPNRQTFIQLQNTHTPPRIRYPPPLPPLYTRNQHMLRTQRNFQLVHKTRPYCIKFKNHGRCNYGANCVFAHSAEGVTTVVGTIKNGLGMMKGGGRNEMDAARVNSGRLCKWFYAGRECPFGVKCVFAHGGLERCRGENLGLWKSNTNTVCVADVRTACSSEQASDNLTPKPLVGENTSYHPDAQIKADFLKQGKWKLQRSGKISGIYADWIEGFPVPC